MVIAFLVLAGFALAAAAALAWSCFFDPDEASSAADAPIELAIARVVVQPAPRRRRR
jgi:hypothetical protein